MRADQVLKRTPHARREDLSPEETGRIGRITAIVLMLVAAAWAPMIRYFPGLWSYIQSVLSYLVPPVVAIFLLGVFWPRTNGNGAFVTLIGGTSSHSPSSC